MAYVKNIWVDQDVERPKTYEVTNNQDGSITLTDSFGLVTELGTPVNEVNMNHIEDGIDGCAIRKHNLTETFNLGEWVLGGIGDDEGIYKSLIANNVGNAITDDTAWGKVEMGGGSSRNIGEIVASTLPLIDAGLHLLDGALIDGNGIYADFVDYIADLYDEISVSGYKSNVTKIGSLTDNNGVLSGFSDSNYAIIPSVFAPNSNTWEMVFQYTTSSNVTTAQSIKGAETGYANVLIRISPNSKFQLYLSSGTSNWDITNNSSIEGTYTVLANTSYWIKLVFDGSKYVLSYSLDGINYINDITVNNSTPVSSSIQWIGRAAAASQYAFGSIDLKESYINIDGQRWWTGAEAIKPVFCTEEQWQASITNYGVCGKFVYDSTLNTVRLPKVTGIIEGTTDVNALGDLVEAGLPDIEGTLPLVQTTGTMGSPAGSSGAFLATETSGTPTSGARGSTYYNIAPHFNASDSNPIYGNSTTVQPQTIKAFYYIVIATSTKTNIQVDIDEIATDLNGKADVDLTNVSNAGTSKGAGWTMPSTIRESLTLGASGTTYTAPANGWISIQKVSGGTDKYLTIFVNSQKWYGTGYYAPYSGAVVQTLCPVCKGDEFAINYNMTGSTNQFDFIYAQGSESEAS